MDGENFMVPMALFFNGMIWGVSHPYVWKHPYTCVLRDESHEQFIDFTQRCRPVAIQRVW